MESRVLGWPRGLWETILQVELGEAALVTGVARPWVGQSCLLTRLCREIKLLWPCHPALNGDLGTLGGGYVVALLGHDFCKHLTRNPPVDPLSLGRHSARANSSITRA